MTRFFTSKVAVCCMIRSHIDCNYNGPILHNIKVDQVLEPGTRVTLEMGTNHNLDEGQ